MENTNFNDLFGRNLMAQLEKHRMPKLELARQLDVSSSIITCWTKGTKIPRMDKVDKMCQIFGCTRAQLLTDQTPRTVKIPVLGEVHAGVPIEAIENIIGYEEITSRLASTGTFFALRVKGDCMAPRFFEGDVVIIRKQSDADHGDIVVAMVNDEEAEIKRLMKYPDGTFALAPTNPIYPATRCDSLTIIGKVVELRAKI